MIYIKERYIGPLTIKLEQPSQATRQRFEGWSHDQLTKYIDASCSCAYCELARQILRDREKQLRLY